MKRLHSARPTDVQSLSSFSPRLVGGSNERRLTATLMMSETASQRLLGVLARGGTHFRLSAADGSLMLRLRLAVSSTNAAGRAHQGPPVRGLVAVDGVERIEPGAFVAYRASTSRGTAPCQWRDRHSAATHRARVDRQHFAPVGARPRAHRLRLHASKTPERDRPPQRVAHGAADGVSAGSLAPRCRQVGAALARSARSTERRERLRPRSSSRARNRPGARARRAGRAAARRRARASRRGTRARTPSTGVHRGLSARPSRASGWGRGRATRRHRSRASRIPICARRAADGARYRLGCPRPGIRGEPSRRTGDRQEKHLIPVT